MARSMLWILFLNIIQKAELHSKLVLIVNSSRLAPVVKFKDTQHKIHVVAYRPMKFAGRGICGGFEVEIVNSQDGSAMVELYLHKFSMFFWPLEVVTGENVLQMCIYVAHVICGILTLWICEMVLRGLHGVL